MNKLNVYDLIFAPYWKQRFEQCAKSVVDAAPNSDASQQLRTPTAGELEGTTWRLAYTNDFSIMPPSRRMAYLTFEDPSTILYSFRTNVPGWTNVQANCPYQIDPTSGIVTFSFEHVTGEGSDEAALDGRMYGMRQGSSRTIRTAFFDGRLWIDFSSSDDKGGSGQNDSRSPKITVYVKEQERYDA